MTLLAEANGAQVHHCDWRALLDVVPACDALIVDAPYSERTHAGHDGGTRYDGSGVEIGDVAVGHRKVTRGINYRPWSLDDVRAFVDSWSPRVVGWFGSITDDILATAWRDALDAAGRYAFAPIPIVEVGSRVRLLGDGPCSWTCWLVVARPSDRQWLAAWQRDRKASGEPCALPGAYVYSGHGDRAVMGGKRTDAMQALVRDYSRPGDLVVDPTCGAGSTLVAAIREGRRAIGGDMNREHAQLAADWISEAWAKSPAIAARQPSLPLGTP